MGVLDLLAVDRGIRELARRHAQFTQALHGGVAEEHAFEVWPGELDRNATGELSEQAGADPLAAALARWLAFLSLEHACIPAKRAVARALFVEEHPVAAPEPGRFTLAALRGRALADAAQRSVWLEALGRHGRALSDRRRELAEWRAERALDLGDPLPAESPGLAPGLIEKTEGAWRELGIGTLTELIGNALGRDLPGTWPSRLSPRALAELATGPGWLSGIEPRLGPPPTVLGASSVLRALEGLGRAFHQAAAGRSQPFALCFDPEQRRAREFGVLFALMPTIESFSTRRLGISSTTRDDFARRMGRLILIETRIRMLREALAREALGGQAHHEDAFEELAHGLLGVAVPRALAGVILVRPAPGLDLRAWLLAQERMDALTQRYDEDWFRNPRAVEAIRAECEAPPELDPTDEPERLERGGSILLRDLNRRLG